ncbi:glucoside xylosyltransferase 1-like isoform X2 [Eriocheir sinensis]|uniref:glucoside xylosyltransferase 1-like isoform X2 n=1 Tax=Eriocheir sinensis TaxID=95602 RepID=UPI0021C5A382|nr:glucoside xylosyltransferase 1-like isoform X2 [Eriocheir sinensis]
MIRVSLGNAYPLVALIYLGVLALMLSHAGPARRGRASSIYQHDNSTYGQDEANTEVVFFIILCEGVAQNAQGGKEASAITRQLRQAAVMLKSAAALTSTSLRFLVVADSEDLYHRFTELTSEWPSDYKRRVAFEWHTVWYPSDREAMRLMFRVCATERLFLPQMFPSLDAAIYIDTDLIFMRPPEDLWMEFKKFDEIQVAAMAPCLYHYDTHRNKVPHYGNTGLNAGVMHMNLTRMKKFPGGGWTAANLKAFDTFKKRIKLADQDILNILFHKYPGHLYELGCEWNYRVFQCSAGNKCPAAYDSGISILHGNAMAFISGNAMKLQTVFEVWEQHRLGEPLSLMLSQMEEKLKFVSSHGLPSKCARTAHIDDILTKELKKHVF